MAPQVPSSSSSLFPRQTFSPTAWPARKTVDLGQNGVTVSADPYGGIYQLSAPLPAHPAYALLIAAPWPQFNQADRTNPTVVRAYRKIMETKLQRCEPGLGLRLSGGENNDNNNKGPVTVWHEKGGKCVRFSYALGSLAVQTVLEVSSGGEEHDKTVVVQACEVTNAGKSAANVQVEVDLAFAVSRASYGQLTDQGEVPMPQATNVVSVAQADHQQQARQRVVTTIENESLGGRLSACLVFHNSTRDEPIKVDSRLFPAPGLDKAPPRMLLDDFARRPRKQTIRIEAGESVKLACVLQTDDMVAGPNGVKPRPMLMDLDVESILAGIVFDRAASRGAGQGEDSAESTILWANLNYIIGCCSIPLGPGDKAPWAVIPDHIALPLGWPRDNYWQLRLLMKLQETDGFKKLFPGDSAGAQEYSRTTNRILHGHLDWLFNVAETNVQVGTETKHFWRRSYLINGRPKDGIVYQLDTQLYPFLQLCEYSKLKMNQPDCVAFVDSIVGTDTFRKVLRDTLSRQDPQTGLFKTDETPADDDTSDFPFHTSSNILLWYTLKQTSELLRRSSTRVAGISPLELDTAADKVYQGILTQLICECNDGSHQQMFAYALDPSKSPTDPSRHRRYHDGNDMPTLFANEWGFLAHDARLPAIWKKTLAWAFTPDPAWTPASSDGPRRHTPGFNSGYAGTGREAFHGLGSDHSDGAWVLGFFQEWRFARIMGDGARERDAWKRIVGAMQWDGTFSEAVDVGNGKCSSKTWFSWPGAMIATELVGELVERE